MKYTFPLLAGLSLMLLLAGCQAGVSPQSCAQEQQCVTVDCEYAGEQGPFPDRGYFVVQRPEAWKALWNQQEVPEVDFAHKTVLVALMGEQPCSGYCTRITAVRPDEQGYTACVTESAPAASAVNAPGPSYPFSMVVVPKLRAPVHFVLAGTPATAGGPYPILDGFQGLTSSTVAPSNTVIRKHATWVRFWASHFGGTAKPPKVDFAHDMAVAVFLGQKPTGGYVVTIPSLQQVDGRLVVHYRMRVPPPDQAVIQGKTSPYAIAIVPSSNLPVVFRSIGGVVTPGKKE